MSTLLYVDNWIYFSSFLTFLLCFKLIRATGASYIPGADPCILCLCEHGKNAWCQAVRCAASEVQASLHLVRILKGPSYGYQD